MEAVPFAMVASVVPSDLVEEAFSTQRVDGAVHPVDDVNREVLSSRALVVTPQPRTCPLRILLPKLQSSSIRVLR